MCITIWVRLFKLLSLSNYCMRLTQNKKHPLTPIYRKYDNGLSNLQTSRLIYCSKQRYVLTKLPLHYNRWRRTMNRRSRRTAHAPRHTSQRMRRWRARRRSASCVWGLTLTVQPPTTLPRSFIIKLDLSSRHIYHQINSWLMTTDKYAHLAAGPLDLLLLATIFEMTTTIIAT